MLFKQAPILLVSALCATSQVFAAVGLDQHINNMESMADKIQVAKGSLDDYQGGKPAALRVARSLKAAQSAAIQARESLSDGDLMTSEEGDRYEDSYERMYPLLLDAIDSAKKKVTLASPQSKHKTDHNQRLPCSRKQD
jgi:hypothetical protein